MTPDLIVAILGFNPFFSPSGALSVRPKLPDNPEHPSLNPASVDHLERHGTYTHTGYPFMQLARETGADYGDVLLYAEWQGNGGMWDQNGPVGTPQQMRAVQNTSYERSLCIDALMRLPVDQRGGDHFPAPKVPEGWAKDAIYD